MTNSIRPSLSRDRARALVKRGMQADTTAEQFRDLVLEQAVDGLDITALREPARHRLALQLLRAWHLWPQWRRLYGTEVPLADRLRRVLLGALREQGRARTVNDLQSDLRETAAVISLRGAEAIRDVNRRLQEPVRLVQRVAETILEPFRRAMDAVRTFLDSVFVPVQKAIENMVRAPAIHAAANVLNRRINLGRADGPMAFLLDAQHRRAAAPPSPPVDDVVVLPDDEALVAFFVGERGDRTWRTGPLGWLLRAVPLPVGVALHARLGESAEEALAWVAERYLRRELRRILEPALAALALPSETQQVLTAGVEHYFHSEWAVADTLLTAGLEGLVFDQAVVRGVLTPGHKLRRTDGKPGSKITSAGNSRLLTAMGFDGSQIAYLTTLSLGSTGNAPRHGGASALGPEIHAAGSLLGVLLVVQWALQDRPLVARALLAAA